MLNGFSAHQSVLLPDSAVGGISVSASKPTDQTRPWLQLDAFGRPVRIYQFAQGAWLSLHTLVPGLTQWWFDVLPNFTTFDGGDANPLSSLSGPMWRQALNSDGVLIAAKFPVAAGTLPSTAVLAQGDVGGEENVTLSANQLAKHTHFVAAAENVIGTAISPTNKMASSQLGIGTADYSLAGSIQDATAGLTSEVGGNATEDAVPHNNMPPFVVGYLLQRTIRQFYAIT
jgi:hypothetical protein